MGSKKEATATTTTKVFVLKKLIKHLTHMNESLLETDCQFRKVIFHRLPLNKQYEVVFLLRKMHIAMNHIQIDAWIYEKN